MWKKISNGRERIMWHDKRIENGFLVVTLLIIFIGGFVCGFGRPG